MNAVESVDQMTPEYRDMVLKLLESQGYREVMAANAFGHALKYVQDLEKKNMIAEHLQEELEHYAVVVSLYKEFGKNLDEVLGSRIADTGGDRNVPLPESWLELAVCQFLYDRAGLFHLTEYKNCSYVPYAKIVGKIVEEEEGHEGFGEKVMEEFCQDPKGRPKAQELFNKWLTVSLLSFGRPKTPGNRFAIEVGLKTRDSGEVMQDFLNDIKPAMVRCGLTFPPADKLGVEPPENVDLSLPG